LALAYAQALERVGKLRRAVSRRLAQSFWKYADISIAMSLCKIPFRMGREASRNRARALTWAANQLEFVGRRHCIDYPELIRRRRACESALYHADAALLAMMADCAARLADAREVLIRSGQTPVFAPLHFCSDAVATMIATMVPPYRCHAYSIYGPGHFGSDVASRMSALNMTLIEHHPNSPPARQREMLRETRAGLANAVIFPDILPQFTTGTLGRVMRTRSVTLFAREARLHSGAEDIARMVGGRLIPYYIHWQDRRLAIRIFDPCRDLQELASCIERALLECGDQWLLWHFPSLFYFNDGERTG